MPKPDWMKSVFTSAHLYDYINNLFELKGVERVGPVPKHDENKDMRIANEEEVKELIQKALDDLKFIPGFNKLPAKEKSSIAKHRAELTYALKLLTHPGERLTYDTRLNPPEIIPAPCTRDHFDKDREGMDHYAYLNDLLYLHGEHALKPGQAIKDKALLLAKVNRIGYDPVTGGPWEASDGALRTKTILKLADASKLLTDDDYKRKYDEELLAHPLIQLNATQPVSQRPPTLHAQAPAPRHLKPFLSPIPIDDVITGFNKIKQTLHNAQPAKYQLKDFNYTPPKEGDSPAVHVFTFPDRESMMQFISETFGETFAKNLVSSQQPTPAPSPIQGQKDIKQSLPRQEHDEEDGSRPPGP